MEGQFRADLYHRLSVFPIHAPALRERPGDIPLLAGYFCERCRVSLGLERLRIQPQTLQLLDRHDWPGNVRELEHAIHRAAVLARAEQGSQTPTLANHHFNLTSAGASPAQVEMAEALAQPQPAGLGLRAATDAFQLRLLEQTLAAQDGNWAATARALEMDGGNLHRLARRLGLKP
ncbi:Anaerobic nitric oxide reductase transcription regulator NorR [compost metagenome]